MIEVWAAGSGHLHLLEYIEGKYTVDWAEMVSLNFDKEEVRQYYLQKLASS